MYIYCNKNYMLLLSSGKVHSMAFHRLAHLTRLDLSACQISTIESGSFEGLVSLQRVYLHGNHLSTILSSDIPPSLHGISVHDNRYKKYFCKPFHIHAKLFIGGCHTWFCISITQTQ